MPRRSEKSTDLAGILAGIQKEQKLTVGGLREAIKPIRAYSTGNIVLDNMTGVGGFPLGRITEVYGDPGSGKTTSAMQAAVTLQNQIIRSGSDDKILYLDFEHAMSPAYAESLGIDPNHCDSEGIKSFLISQPHFMEQGSLSALKLIKTGKIRMVIYDSVAEMVPQDEEEDEDEIKNTAGMNRARVLQDILLRNKGYYADNNCAAIFINHLKMSIPMGYGQIAKEKNPGGKSLPFYSSLRLMFAAGKKIKTDVYDPYTDSMIPMVTDIDTTVTATKNKMAHGYKQAEMRIHLGHGFDNTWSVLQILINYGLVVKSGGWYYMDPRGKENLGHPDMDLVGGRPGFQGEKEVLKFARSHPDWEERITKMAEATINNDSNALRYDGPVNEEGYDSPVVVREILEVDNLSSDEV